MVETRPDSTTTADAVASRAWLTGALLLVLAIGAAYANSLRVPFTFDDFRSITENASLSTPAKWLSPPENAGVGGRPLLNLSFGLNYALGKLEPAGYHVFNVAVHAACALLVFGVARLILGRPPLHSRIGAQADRAAFAIALWWALHPLHTESITYVSQRAEALAGFFLLATLYAFLRSLDAMRPRRWQVLSVAACFLGVTVKEILILAPLVVFACDWIFGAGSWRGCWRARSSYYLALAASWVLLAWLITQHDIESRGVGFSHNVPVLTNLLVAGAAFARYLRLSVWPEGVVLDYGTIDDVGPLLGRGPLAIVAVVIIGTGVAAWRRRAPLVCFGIGGFFLLLLPTTGLVPVPSQPVAEHRMYLPLLPLLAALVLGGFTWLGRRAFAPLVALALLGGGLTFARNRDYRSPESLWGTSIARFPENPRARSWMIGIIMQSNRLDEALVVAREGLKFRPRQPSLHRDYGRLLRAKGETEQALLAATMAVALDGGDVDSRTNLYQLHGMLGQLDRSLPHMLAAWQLRPGDPTLANNLAHVLLQLGRRDEAVRFAREAVRLAPADAGAHGNLAMALLALDQRAEAVAEHAAWLKLQPAGAPPNHEFARALIEKQAWPEARAEIAELLGRHPADATTLELRAVVERAAGDGTVKKR